MNGRSLMCMTHLKSPSVLLRVGAAVAVAAQCALLAYWTAVPREWSPLVVAALLIAAAAAPACMRLIRARRQYRAARSDGE